MMHHRSAGGKAGGRGESYLINEAGCNADRLIDAAALSGNSYAEYAGHLHWVQTANYM